jgi:hypothetical protein
MLIGRGESQKALQIGLSEAVVLLRKIGSFGDPRLYALSIVAQELANSKQPLVPERLFVTGGGHANGDGKELNAGSGVMQTLLSLLVAEKSGFSVADSPEYQSLKVFAEKMTQQTLEAMETAAPVAIEAPPPAKK